MQSADREQWRGSGTNSSTASPGNKPETLHVEPVDRPRHRQER
jgi:hypothetical protein